MIKEMLKTIKDKIDCLFGSHEKVYNTEFIVINTRRGSYFLKKVIRPTCKYCKKEFISTDIDLFYLGNEEEVNSKFN